MNKQRLKRESYALVLKRPELKRDSSHPQRLSPLQSLTTDQLIPLAGRKPHLYEACPDNSPTGRGFKFMQGQYGSCVRVFQRANVNQ